MTCHVRNNAMDGIKHINGDGNELIWTVCGADMTMIIEWCKKALGVVTNDHTSVKITGGEAGAGGTEDIATPCAHTMRRKCFDSVVEAGSGGMLVDNVGEGGGCTALDLKHNVKFT